MKTAVLTLALGAAVLLLGCRGSAVVSETNEGYRGPPVGADGEPLRPPGRQ